MLLKGLITTIVILCILLGLQSWRLGNCQAKAKQLETCQEVNKLKEGINNATDDDLTNSISNPD